MSNKQTRGIRKGPSKVAVLIDDNGKVAGHFITENAAIEAIQHRDACVKGGCDYMKHTTIVTGDKAIKALREGRL